MRTTAIALITALALGGPSSKPDHRTSTSRAVIPHCQVFLMDDVDVPAQEAGLLVALNVEEGDLVQEGQLLAQIDDRQSQLQKLAAELERDVAQARADDDIEVRYAVKSFELADAELQQDTEINQKSAGAIPASEIRRKRLARHRAELQIDRSKLDRTVARMTADVQNAAVRSAEESILRRRIVAPFDGIVIDIHRESAEWVNVGEAVLRVVRMDRLTVDGFLDGNRYNPSDVAGRPVTVEIDLARGRKEYFEGRIVFVTPMVQAGNKYRVRAEVQNREEQGQSLLRPGMTATMVIPLSS